MKRIALVASGFLFATTAWAQGPRGKPPKSAHTAAAPAAEHAHADIKTADGKAIGTADLEETPRGVLITVKLDGAPAGTHAFHIHETGKCEPPFKSAGGHFNPAGHKHGYKNPAGEHAGDLPNVTVPDNGKAEFQFLAPGVTLKPDERNSLLDADGSALVMHAKADDMASDPAGNAGDRIACGVVEKGAK